ncbi:unnamed protein product [Ceutorhynchus assimilis]|uniref:Uncharacterized protein n=1 Tax=Ceutorhynchus assimilis TaxID=467358 RepID=A0A9N9MUD0_9CUCU|nr:unnamed protein product [Ceutorhynchus assimilis]
MKKMARTLRTEGKAYVSSYLRKQVPQRIMKPRCDSQKCKNYGCKLFTDEEYQEIFHAFYNIQSLQLQREFVVRHINENNVKKRRTAATEFISTTTLAYCLPKAEDH